MSNQNRHIQRCTPRLCIHLYKRKSMIRQKQNRIRFRACGLSFSLLLDFTDLKMITEATGAFESNTSLMTEEMTDIEPTPLSPWEDDYAINTFFLVCTILMLFVGTIGNVLVIGKFWYFAGVYLGLWESMDFNLISWWEGWAGWFLFLVFFFSLLYFIIGITHLTQW